MLCLFVNKCQLASGYVYYLLGDFFLCIVRESHWRVLKNKTRGFIKAFSNHIVWKKFMVHSLHNGTRALNHSFLSISNLNFRFHCSILVFISNIFLQKHEFCFNNFKYFQLTLIRVLLYFSSTVILEVYNCTIMLRSKAIYRTQWWWIKQLKL